jgi:DNA-binding SARP family transcriptional activator
LPSSSPLDSLTPDNRIIVIHPQYERARSLLARLLAQACYLAVDETVSSIEAFTRLLNQAAAHQAVAVEQVGVVIIDEADRVSDDLIIAFVGHLLQRMHPHSRIVVYARQLPTRLIAHTLWQKWICVFNPEPMFENDDPDEGDAAREHLRVFAFGHGRAMLEEKTIVNWGGALPQSLFFFMIDRQLVARYDVFNIFWPAMSTQAATNVFHVTKRKISDVLGFELTRYGGGFYRLSPLIRLSYDVSRFLDIIAQAEQAPPGMAIRMLRYAVHMYRSGYLSTIDAEWAKLRRHQLEVAYIDALVQLARLLIDQGDDTAALGSLLRALHFQVYREDIALMAMQLYMRLNMNADALSLYERVRDELKATLGVKPNAALMQLAQTLGVRG